MRSSYIQHGYKEVFYAIVRAFQPVTCVELGVLDGYSSMSIGFGFQKNGRGTLNSYDLFEDYPYNHGDKERVRDLMDEYGLQNIVSLFKADAFTVHNYYNAMSVDFLHVDVSNTGETIKKIMQAWDEKMVIGGIICFEGGTQERDQIEWMRKYNAPPIKPELENNEIIKDKYIFGTYLKFPGLTMLLKKR